MFAVLTRRNGTQTLLPTQHTRKITYQHFANREPGVTAGAGFRKVFLSASPEKAGKRKERKEGIERTDRQKRKDRKKEKKERKVRRKRKEGK